MDRKSAVGTLRQIARLLELGGKNPYRVRAFTGAARAIEKVEGDLEQLVVSGDVLELKGVGKGTAAVLADLAAGVHPQALAEAEADVPPGVREMLNLGGLGPKKVRVLWRELGVESLGELEYACRENRLVDLKGFGETTQSAVLEAVRFAARSRDRRLLHQAWAEAEATRTRLSSVVGIRSVEVAGELRRGNETIGEVAFVVVLENHGDEAAATAALGPSEQLATGVWRHTPAQGLPVRLWIAPPDRVGSTMVRATGAEEFVEAMADIGSIDIGGDEASVFAELGLAWVPPELRRDASWLGAATVGSLPDLVELEDLRGVLHNHTTDSDGAATLDEMATAAEARGWRYFGVADHSPAAVYANGVDADRLADQWARADAWNATHPRTRIIKGIEADILPDGSLDIPAGCEEGLDYVVASVHSSFRLNETAQTDRLVAAVRHPACRVLGHPTGRLLLARPGYAVDLERVLDACAESGVAVEINASPYRMDVDQHWARQALERGIKLAVNPDAHSVGGLDDVRWGLAVARAAGATAEDLVDWTDIIEWMKD